MISRWRGMGKGLRRFIGKIWAIVDLRDLNLVCT